MVQPETPAFSETQVPKNKSGCGCFLWGCFTTLLVLVLLMVGSGVAFWYGIKRIAIPDPVVVWTYQEIVKPKVLEALPPNLTPQQRNEITALMDSGLEKYLKLPPDEKKLLLKESVVAAYYYSQNRVIPPEKIPHLSRFVKEHLQEFQNKERLPPKGLGP